MEKVQSASIINRRSRVYSHRVMVSALTPALMLALTLVNNTSISLAPFTPSVNINTCIKNQMGSRRIHKHQRWRQCNPPLWTLWLTLSFDVCLRVLHSIPFTSPGIVLLYFWELSLSEVITKHICYSCFVYFSFFFQLHQLQKFLNFEQFSYFYYLI